MKMKKDLNPFVGLAIIAGELGGPLLAALCYQAGGTWRTYVVAAIVFLSGIAIHIGMAVHENRLPSGDDTATTTTPNKDWWALLDERN